MLGRGILAEEGGHAVVTGVQVKDNQRTGVLAHGPGSRVEIEGGSVTGSKEYYGISAQQGGHAVVKGVRVEDNQSCGVLASGQGSRVEVEGGSVSGCKDGSGISAERGLNRLKHFMSTRETRSGTWPTAA